MSDEPQSADSEPSRSSRISDIGSFIAEQRRLAELSVRKLSAQAGISNPYLSQIERGLRQPSAAILKQIAQALHISAETLYQRAGLLDDDEAAATTPDVVRAISEDDRLSEDDKQTLIRLYHALRLGEPAESASTDT